MINMNLIVTMVLTEGLRILILRVFEPDSYFAAFEILYTLQNKNISGTLVIF